MWKIWKNSDLVSRLIMRVLIEGQKKWHKLFMGRLQASYEKKNLQVRHKNDGTLNYRSGFNSIVNKNKYVHSTRVFHFRGLKFYSGQLLQCYQSENG